MDPDPEILEILKKLKLALPERWLGVMEKPFEVDCYLNESYTFTSYNFKGTSCMAAILTALLKKDSKVIQICVWTLASHETRFSRNTHGPTGLTSFVEILQRKEVTQAEQFEINPTMEEWVKAVSAEPGFEIFTLALAMFIIGFPSRKLMSQRNQLTGAKWKQTLKNMSSFAPSIPKWIKINFLKKANVSDSDIKAACGACLFLERSRLGRELRKPTLYGIVRPVCDRQYTVYSRYEEFKRLYPEAFLKGSRFSELPHASEGLESVKDFGKAIVAAKQARAQLQPFMIRSIDRRYFRSMDVSLTKHFQSYLLYCICHRKGRRGRESWQAYTESEGTERKCIKPQLDMYERWVMSLKV